jgi:16S rRNA processing protein RimM
MGIEASGGRAGPAADGPAPVELIVVGRVGPARGVRGDVFVEPWTDAPDERFANGTQLRTEPDTAGPLTVESASTAGGKLVVRFEGVTDRSAAEALRGTTLLIPADSRPTLDDPDEFYDTDLVGLAAVTANGLDLGPVRDVVHAAGASYLVLEAAGRDRLVPFVRAIVPTVDLTAGRVVIDPPAGLLDL